MINPTSGNRIEALSADQLSADELCLLCLLSVQSRRKLRRLLSTAPPPARECAPGIIEAAGSSENESGTVEPADRAPASAADRSRLLDRAREQGLLPGGAASGRRRAQRTGMPQAETRLRKQLRHNGLSVLWYEQLPLCLRAIPDPPWVLYSLGNPDALPEGGLEPQVESGVAIVGARAATARGCRWTRRLAGELSSARLRVVSGLALGIDAAAHQGCLDVAAAPTIAVLGSGLDQPTPRQNRRLAGAIVAAGGVLLSEYAPGQRARAHHFPERNRIVTGLSRGLVVVEAGERSGSLISARLALEQGRELMAVPGPVGLESSAGCHRLLRQGATLVTCAAEVMEALGVGGVETPAASIPALTDMTRSFAPTDAQLAQQLYLACDAIPQPLPVLVEAVQGNPARVAHLLTLLELNGFIDREHAGYTRR